MGILDVPAAPFGASQTAPLIQRLRAGNEDATLTVLGDSTGNETWEWVYLLTAWLADQFPAYTVLHRVWNHTNQNYDAATTVQTGTGSKTLTVYNGSTPGQITSYSYDTTRFPLQIPVAPQLVMVNYGYNEGTGVTTAYRPKLYDLTRRIEDKFPGAGIIVTAQPPVGALAAIVNADHMVRGRVVAELAASEGYGLVNVLQTYLDNPSWEADWINATDHLHPVAAGQLVWFNQVKRLFPITNTLRPRTPALFEHRKFFPASGDWAIRTGAPVFGNAGATGNLSFKAWEFLHTAEGAVSFLVDWPDSWQYVNIYVDWSYLSGSGFTGANNGVRWGVGFSRLSLTSGTPFQGTATTVGNGAHNAVTETVILSSAQNAGGLPWNTILARGVSNTAITSRPVGIRIRRDPVTEVLDTMNESAFLRGVWIERAG